MQGLRFSGAFLRPAGAFIVDRAATPIIRDDTRTAGGGKTAVCIARWISTRGETGRAWRHDGDGGGVRLRCAGKTGSDGLCLRPNGAQACSHG